MVVRKLLLVLLICCLMLSSCAHGDINPTSDNKNDDVTKETIKNSIIFYTNNIDKNDVDSIISLLDSMLFLDDPGVTMKLDQKDDTVILYIVTAKVVIESGVFMDEQYALLADMLAKDVFSNEKQVVFSICDSNYNVVKEIRLLVLYYLHLKITFILSLGGFLAIRIML